MKRLLVCLLLVLSGVFTAQTVRALGESKTEEPRGRSVNYLADIKPLLRDKCFSCHSSRKQEGGLRLDAASLIRKGGESGPAFHVSYGLLSAERSLLQGEFVAVLTYA